MRVQRILVSGVLGAAAFLGSAQVSKADATALAITGGTVKNDYGGSVGYSFSVGSQSITVTQLGYYNGAGFLADGASHQVAIYNDATHAQLGTVATITGNATTAAAAGGDQFVYTPVTPFTLAANTTYDIAASNLSGTGVSGGNNDYLIQASGVAVGAGLTYGTSRYAGSSVTVEYPTNTFSGNDVGNIGPNFQYTVVPEPASLSAVGISGLLMLCRRSRR